MKRTPSSTSVKSEPSNLRKELKRSIIMLISLSVLVMMIVSWKTLMMPMLAEAFSAPTHLNEVNTLLMIIGILGIVSIILGVTVIIIILKIQSMSKEFAIIMLAKTAVEKMPTAPDQREE